MLLHIAVGADGQLDPEALFADENERPNTDVYLLTGPCSGEQLFVYIKLVEQNHGSWGHGKQHYEYFVVLQQINFQ